MNKKKEDILSKNRIIYLDILKIFACFMVITNHSIWLMLENKTCVNTIFYCITFSLSKVGVGLFLMITGVLVLNKDYDYKKILKCILRVFIPVCIFSFLFHVQKIGIRNMNIFRFFEETLSKPYIISYWYIYALIGVYLTLPFIQKMIKKFTNKDYLFFILMFLILPTFINFLQMYLNINVNYNFQLSFFSPIIATIICGNYISQIKLSKKILISSIAVFLLSCTVMFLSMYLPYFDIGEPCHTLDAWDSFPIVLMFISVFYIIRYLFEKKNYSKRVANIITVISSTTFGIYLIHTEVIAILSNIKIIQILFDFNTIIAITVLNFIVFIVSMIIIYVLKKAPFINKIL